MDSFLRIQCRSLTAARTRSPTTLQQPAGRSASARGRPQTEPAPRSHDQLKARSLASLRPQGTEESLLLHLLPFLAALPAGKLRRCIAAYCAAPAGPSDVLYNRQLQSWLGPSSTVAGAAGCLSRPCSRRARQCASQAEMTAAAWRAEENVLLAGAVRLVALPIFLQCAALNKSASH